MIKKEWGSPKQRVIGHIRSSPALAFNVGPEGFTEDWGAFELDGSRFKDAFRGNFIDLGTFRFSLPGNLVLSVAIRHGDPVRPVHRKNVSSRRRADDLQVPQRSSP
jgi:hypothetical protein